jgi:hypothetical protein
MLDPRFVILGAILQLYGTAQYAISTYRGHTQPNRITWIMWMLAPLIAFAAEITQGVGLQSLMTFIVGFSPAIVLVASFANRKSYWKITRLDAACGLLSGLAIILWLVTRTGNIAIFFSVLADSLAALPTIIKAFRHPETEHPSVFALGIANAGITLLTIKTWDFANTAFPLYIFLLNVTFTLLITRPRWSRAAS